MGLCSSAGAPWGSQQGQLPGPPLSVALLPVAHLTDQAPGRSIVRMTQGMKVGREGGWSQRWGHWTWVTVTL